MRQKSVPVNEPATQVLKNVRSATRRHFSAEDKIRIVLEGLRGEDSIAELCPFSRGELSRTSLVEGLSRGGEEAAWLARYCSGRDRRTK